MDHPRPAMHLARKALQFIICAACLVWVLWWFVSNEPAQYLDAEINENMQSRFFRTDDKYGSVLIYQTAPFIIVAILSFFVIELRTRERNNVQNSSNLPGAKANEEGDGSNDGTGKRRLTRPSILTYPLWVRSPLGVLTAAEVLFILGILFLIVFSFGRMTYFRLKDLDVKYMAKPETFMKVSLTMQKLGRASRNFGKAGLIPFSLLWIPVSRGSPFLRLIRLPFEHAVKYHVWLATITLSMLSIHGIGYTVYYVKTDRAHEIMEWEKEGETCSVVAGVVALLAGLVMWVTSLSFFRRRYYEVFIGVHHLYIVFVVFWLYHMVSNMHFFVIPVLLFVVDRLLRMVQSRQSVDVLSARVLESGAIELKLARKDSQDLEYHALSSWYLRFPSLSRFAKFQWHFFSVTSTPLDEKRELSIVIKPLGGWTKNLKDQLLLPSTTTSTVQGLAKCPFSFSAGVEGPYGDETDFYLRYPCLVLVAGGIGVTPMLAILRDILHRRRTQKRQGGLPSSIKLYHCLRKGEELCVLNSLDPNHILPGYSNNGDQDKQQVPRTRVHAYVTSSLPSDYTAMPAAFQAANTPADAAGSSPPAVLDLATFGGVSSADKQPANVVLRSPVAESRVSAISSISSKGQPLWVACTVLASILGFYVFWGLGNVRIIKHPDTDFPYNYDRVHIIVASMLLGPALFGGLVVLLWWLDARRRLAGNEGDHQHHSSKISSAASPLPSGQHGQELQQTNIQNHPYTDFHDVEVGGTKRCPWNGTLHLQSRPQWKEIFDGLSKEYAGENVGVLVSGSQSMQEDVAKECRRLTKLFDSTAATAIFHYHSVSFEL